MGDQTIIVLGLLAFCLFQAYITLKTKRAQSKVKEVFMEKNKDVEFYDDAKGWTWIYLGVAVFCVGVGIYHATIDDYMMLAGFCLAAVFALFNIAMTRLKRSCYLGKEEFLYDDQILKYKNITEVEERRGMMVNQAIHFGANKEIVVTKNIRDELLKRKKEAKKLKKMKK